MRQPGLVERLRYRFDTFMSRGTIALIGGLGLLSLVVIFTAALVISLAGIRPEGAEDSLSFSEAAWESLMRTMDAGTMGGDAGWGFRLIMFGVTLGGVFIISTLIGVLTSGIESKLDELRKGRSRVVESGHTVILGWSSQIFSVIAELVIANSNQKDACIVILAPKDMVEMQDEIDDKVGSTGKTRIVCRTGNPIDLGDLEIVSLPTSKSVIILSPETDYPDADVIKATMAVINRPDRRPEPYHIVAELRNPANLEVARLVGKDEAEWVVVGELVARIVAQTCLQSGLSLVYSELLDFGGDEIYMKEEPALVGKTYGEALLAYRDSSVIGIRPQAGLPQLNPGMDRRITAGDQLVVISADDDTIRFAGWENLGVERGAIRLAQPSPAAPKSILMLGWNKDAGRILGEIDHYVPAGSRVSVVSTYADVEDQVNACCLEAANIQISFRVGQTHERRVLQSLDLGAQEHIILLAYTDHLDDQRADAFTLVTLLHLRDLSDQNGYDYAIVSQILDVRNRALAEVTRADDFIVSDRLASLMVAQVAENKHLNAVFADIFDPEGAEIYLKPVSDYLAPGKPVNYYTVVEAARQRGHTALGYRIKSLSRDPAQGYGVVVNPDKTRIVTFAVEDRLIVLAED